MSTRFLRPGSIAAALFGTLLFGLQPTLGQQPNPSGTGAQVMKRLAAPMVGGLFSAALLTLVVLPAAYMLIQRYRYRHQLRAGSDGQSQSVPTPDQAQQANPS